MAMTVRARVITCAYARVKAKKVLQMTSNFFWVRFRPFWAFQNFPRVRVRARVFSVHSTYGKSKCSFMTCFGILTLYLTISNNFQSFSTYNKAIRARQIWKSARAFMCNNWEKLSKTWLSLNGYSSEERMVTPIFYYIFVKPMKCRYHFMHDLALLFILLSWYCQLKWKFWFWIFSVIFDLVFITFFILPEVVSRLFLVQFPPNFDML